MRIGCGCLQRHNSKLTNSDTDYLVLLHNLHTYAHINLLPKSNEFLPSTPFPGNDRYPHEKENRASELVALLGTNSETLPLSAPALTM